MRYILIDRITELEPGRRMRGLKNVTMSDSLMMSYGPNLTALPATMVLEAMAQGVGLLLVASTEFSAQPVLAKVESFFAFAQPRPGDQIIVSAELENLRTEGCRAHVRAEVENSLVAEATVYLALVPLSNERRSEDLRARILNLFPECLTVRADETAEVMS